MDGSTLKALKSILSAAEEASTEGVHSREQIVIWALEYGSRLGVTRSQIESLLDQPLSQILELSEKGNNEPSP